MTTLVNLNGELLPPAQATISVFDRGFLFGDSVYETIRTYRGRPFLLDRHLDRLARSADGLYLPVPRGLDAVRAEVVRTIEAAENDESYVRIILTRGANPGLVNLDLATAGPGAMVLIVTPFRGFPAAAYDEGVDVALVGVLRTGRLSLDPRIKSGNYLNNILALREAKRAGAFECLMPNREGDLTEGSTSNVFLVQDGRLRTPSLDCGLLDGITRSFVLEVAAAAGIAVEETRLAADDLAAADEVFLTSSLKEVMPVRAIVLPEGGALWSGGPGPVTQNLLSRYRARALAETGP